MTLNGFASHLDPDSLCTFHQHKILIGLEEGDTSQNCQAYNQVVAKADKRHLRNLLSGFRTHARMISQWDIVLIANAAMNKVRAKDWIVSLCDTLSCHNFGPS